MEPIAAEGSKSKEFIENKEVVQRLLEGADKQTLTELKDTIKKIEKDIKKKKNNAYAQFKDIA